MARNHPSRMLASLAIIVGLGLAATGCSAGTGSGPSAVGSYSFGKSDRATGNPVDFGTLNLGFGPVIFPEVLQAEEAAVDYVNEYRGGIGGHPIVLLRCLTDGQPSTSAQWRTRC